MSQKF